MANGNFGGGTGTLADPFLIEDLADLFATATYQSKTKLPQVGYHFKLITDIDASKTAMAAISKTTWEPIVTDNDGGAVGSYIASIDFNFKAIKNLYINKPTSDYVGFISAKTSGDASKNKILKGRFENVDITGKDYVGAVCGHIATAPYIIDGLYVSGTIKGSSYVGGICGKCDSEGGIISNCEVNAKVKGGYYIGGIIGWTNSGVKKSVTKGEVAGLDYVGGLLGYSPNPRSYVVDCVALLDYITREGGISSNFHRICGYLNMGVLTNNKAVETLKFRY